MTDLTIYAGEDFALLLSAMADTSDTPEDISDYDVVAQLSTTSIGNRIIASTRSGSELEIVRVDTSHLAVNVSHSLTSTLSDGVVILSVMLIHKQTGAQVIAESKTIEIKRSKLTV